MKTILMITIFGAGLAVFAITMGAVLGSVEFAGKAWKISTLACMAAGGGVLIGSGISFAVIGPRRAESELNNE